MPEIGSAKETLPDHLQRLMETVTCGGSMSAYMNGPWRCGGYRCDRGPDCTATKRNLLEAKLIAVRARDDEWENGWRAATGLPLLTFTMRDARSAADEIARRAREARR